MRVLDEPTAGLDPKERVRFRNLIASFAQDKIVILSTHIVPDIEYIADQILVMRAGSIVCRGTVEDIVQYGRGAVWECAVTPREADELAARFTAGNLHYGTDGMAVVRVVAERRPHPRAVPAEPTLEDVYLYLFQESSGEGTLSSGDGAPSRSGKKGGRRG